MFFVVMLFIMVIMVVVRFENNRIAAGQMQGAFCIKQRNHSGITGECVHGLVQIRAKRITNPEHHICLIQRLCLGWAQGMVVGVGPCWQQLERFAHALHHLGDQ